MIDMDMNLPMLVTPTPLLSHFITLVSMVSLAINSKLRTFLIKMFISLNKYLKVLVKFRFMTAFIMLESMFLVSLDMVSLEFF